MRIEAKEIGHRRLVYTVRESAYLLNLCPKSIYRLIQRGKLRCITSVRHKRIPHTEIERFLRENLI